MAKTFLLHAMTLTRAQRNLAPLVVSAAAWSDRRIFVQYGLLDSVAEVADRVWVRNGSESRRHVGTETTSGARFLGFKVE